MGKVIDVKAIGGEARSTTFIIYDDCESLVEFWWHEMPHLRKLLDELEREHEATKTSHQA